MSLIDCSLKMSMQGHNKPITALTVTADRREIYTAGSDGNICIHLCLASCAMSVASHQMH